MVERLLGSSVEGLEGYRDGSKWQSFPSTLNPQWSFKYEITPRVY